jgi:hypothetical protein
MRATKKAHQRRNDFNTVIKKSPAYIENTVVKEWHLCSTWHIRRPTFGERGSPNLSSSWLAHSLNAQQSLIICLIGLDVSTQKTTKVKMYGKKACASPHWCLSMGLSTCSSKRQNGLFEHFLLPEYRDNRNKIILSKTPSLT